jgi:hypothetical protein
VSSDDKEKQYLVDSTSKVVFAAKFGDSPVVPVCGLWRGEPAKEKLTVDQNTLQEQWFPPIVLASYSSFSGFPGTSFTSEWTDYIGSASRMPPLNTSTDDPRSTIPGQGNLITQYYWPADLPTATGVGAFPMYVLIRPTQKQHMLDGLQPLESAIDPLIYVYPTHPDENKRVLFSETFPPINVLPRPDADSAVVKAINPRNQNEALTTVHGVLVRDDLQYDDDDDDNNSNKDARAGFAYVRMFVREARQTEVNDAFERVKAGLTAADMRTDGYRLLYLAPSNDFRACICAVYDATKRGVDAVFDKVVQLSVLDVLPLGEDYALPLRLIDDDESKVIEKLDSLINQRPAPPPPLTVQTTTTIERDWRSRLDFLLLAPQNLHTRIRFEVTFHDSAAGRVVTTAGNVYLPVLYNQRIGTQEALLMLPPYNTSKGTRLGRLPTPVTGAGAPIGAPFSLETHGRVTVKLFDVDKNTERPAEGEYNLSFAFLRLNRYFSVVISDAQDPSFNTRIFIEVDYRRGTLPFVAGISVEYR